MMTLQDVTKVAPDVAARDIWTIIYANHAKEILTEKGAKRVTVGGFKNVSELDAALAQLQVNLGPEKFARATQGAEVIKNLCNGELQRMIDSGLVSKDLAEIFRTKYPWYNTLQYLEDADRLGVRGKGIKLGTVISSRLKRLTKTGTFQNLGFEFLVLMIFVTVFSFWPSPDFGFKWHVWLVCTYAVIGLLILEIFWLGIRYLWKRNKQHKDDED